MHCSIKLLLQKKSFQFFPLWIFYLKVSLLQQNLDMEYIHVYILYNNSQLIRYPRTGVAYRNVLDMGLLVTIKLLNQSGKVEVNINLVHAFFFFFFFFTFTYIQWIVCSSIYGFWIPLFLNIYSTTIFSIRKDRVRSN